jgi:hypothetical protein
MAWRENISHLIVESGSKNLVDMINDNCKFNETILTLVWCIRKLLSLRLTVQINHTWRERNRSADWFANFNISRDSKEIYDLETPPMSFRVFYLITSPDHVCLGMSF